ncbi:MAG: mechanosensitive ion channel family protein, partial [Candidatus Methanomethyliaceae archaeon]|nr:mechanosensitive ion channel family protein [Candidatus Methanomethyliaceae archaeon]
LIRRVLLKAINNWSLRTGVSLGEVILNSIKTPSITWCIALGLYLGISISEIPEKYLLYLNKFIIVIIIFSVSLAISNLAVRLIQFQIQRSNLPFPSTGLIFTILSSFIMITGFLLILTTLGISITPIITALGIGGLAIALALKDTLSNLFAGIHILVERSIRVGDFIKLESGQEGSVEDLTWRTARIKTISNNMVIIPNNKLSQSVVTNYSLPERRMSIMVPVSVSYSSDIEKVEKILLDIAKKSAGEIQGLLDEPPPIVRFNPGFSESSLDFMLICNIKEFKFQNPVQHELRKRILERFREEGIEIPYPHRIVYLRSKEEV